MSAVKAYSDIALWSEEHRDEFLKYQYLELGDTYTMDIDNAFDEALLTERDPLNAFISLCLNPKYLNFPAKHIMNMDLFPYQLSILNTLWTKRLPMLIAARGGAKTTMLGLYILLRALLDQGIKIVVAGAGLRQSGLVFEAMMQIWDNAPVLQDICGGAENRPKRTNLGFEWRPGKSIVIGVPIGTGEKIRGLRANIIAADEFGSINPEIFETVIRGFAAVRSHNTFETVQKAYQKKVLQEMGLFHDYEDDDPNLDKFNLEGNQIIISGTATYEFNHFYKYFDNYSNIIKNKGRVVSDNMGDDDSIDYEDYAVIRIPYNQLPIGLMDEEILKQGAAIMDSSIYQMEYGAVFSKDSDGFFKASILHNATCDGENPIIINDEVVDFTVELRGKPNGTYVMGLDPASERDNLTISIAKILPTGHRLHVYTWAANRKTFEADRKKNKASYSDIYDYNTFIVTKIHDLVQRFNIQRFHIDSGGGGTSIIEGLKDPSKLKEGQICLYDMDDPEVAGEKGLHIIKVVQFSDRVNWYEPAHYNLLKDLTLLKHIFPKYDSLGIERQRLTSSGGDLINDSLDDILGNIEQVKYQTTLIQEKTTSKGSKTWDLPKVTGVETETLRIKLRKDHFTSLLLVNDAARGYLGDTEEDSKVTPGLLLSSHVKQEPKGKMYRGAGLGKLNQSDHNQGKITRTIRKSDGGTISY